MSKKQKNIAASTHTLHDRAGMPIDFSDEESLTDGKPMFTPSESLVDDTCSERTSTMRDNLQDELDDRPETSPYISPIFTLLVGPSRVQYTIQEEFLNQCPQWAEKCRSKPWGNKIALPDVDEDIGHSLVHYLYTGNYQTLKLPTISSEAPDGAENPTATSMTPEAHSLLEYSRSVRLYCVARTYGLDGLEDMSLCHIENSQDGISIWNVLDLAKKAYEKLPDEEFWFTGYLRRKIEAALGEEADLLTRKEFLGHVGTVKKFDQALMKIIAELYNNKG